MKGSEFIASLPEAAGPTRERAILSAVEAGYALPTLWVELASSRPNGARHAVLRVASDALAIGEPDDWVRVACTARTSQLIADILGALLPTTRVSDLAWQQATVRCTPHTQPTEGMELTSHFVHHHTTIELQRAGRPGLVATVGKDWVLSRRLIHFPGMAVTYGWHQTNGSPIQERGPELKEPAHNLEHVDYSQFGPRLLHPKAMVDGEEMDVGDMLASPELCDLVSDEGVIPFTRLPMVTQWAPPNTSSFGGLL